MKMMKKVKIIKKMKISNHLLSEVMKYIEV